MIILPSEKQLSNSNSGPDNVFWEHAVSWNNKNLTSHFWGTHLILDSGFPKGNIKQTKDYKCMATFCSWAINYNLQRLVSVGASYLISDLFFYYFVTLIYLLVIIISQNEYNFILGRSSFNLSMSFLSWTLLTLSSPLRNKNPQTGSEPWANQC